MSLLRPRNLLAAAVVLLVVGVAAILLVPPLGTGHAGVAVGPPDVDQTTNGQTGAAEIRYRPLARVGFGVEVRNTTFLPVTIDGPTDGLEATLLRDARLVLGTEPGYLGLEEDHVRPFAAITLAPGAAQLIGVVGTFPRCEDARPNWATGTGVIVQSLLLDVRLAGVIPLQTEVPLLIQVNLLGDADAACP